MTTGTDSPAGRDRARRPRLVDVARHAGVSIASASKAVREAYGVSDEMRRRVSAAVDELGYRPDRLARGMRGSTRTLGLMVPAVENSFINLIIQGMSPVLAEAGYDLFIVNGSPDPKMQDHTIDALLDHQMDGLVLVAPRQPQARLEQIGASIPLVVVGRHGPADNYHTIASDDRAGSGLIVNHLYALGHRDISFIAESPKFDYSTLPENVRLAGYKEAMSRVGLADKIDVVFATWTVDGGRAAADEILARPTRPSAIHAGADVAAIGLLSKLWEMNLDAPAALSVAGYDNSPTGALGRIGLTSVEQEGEQMGTLAARTLLDTLQGRIGHESTHLLLPPRLVVRTTTGTPSVAH